MSQRIEVTDVAAPLAGVLLDVLEVLDHLQGGADLCDRLLEACAKLGEAELAVLTVQSMHALGLPVGYVAHGSVLRALCLAGYHEVCEASCNAL